MKFNKYLICALFLVLICCIGAASAAEADDVVAADDAIDEEVTEAVDVSDEIDEEPLGVSEEPALSDGETPSSSEMVIYVGTNGTDGGDGSPENPFATFNLACDYANTQNKSQVTLNIYNGTYYLDSYLKFNTSNLVINGIGSPIIKNFYKEENTVMAFGLVSSSSKYTISNVIYDASDRLKDVALFSLFYGGASYGEFNNCSFVSYCKQDIGATMMVPGGSYSTKFNNCYFYQIISNKIFDTEFIYDKNSNFVTEFENCSFDLPNVISLISGKQYKKPQPVVTIKNCWLGKNTFPTFIHPPSGYIANSRGLWITSWTITVDGYALFSIYENYLGNNQYEIIGKLTWDDENNTASMENFQPMNVSLSSLTGEIQSYAILTNGTFKAIYTSNSSEHSVSAILGSEFKEITFKSVNVTVDAPSIYYGEDQNITVTLPQAINATANVIINNKTYNLTFNDTNSVTYAIEDRLTEGNYTVDVILSDVENHVWGSNSTVLSVSKVSNYVFDVIPAVEVKVGENATIDITLPVDVEGNVTIKFGNDTKILPANQTMTVDFTNLNATTYDVTVTYSGSDKYIPNKKTDTVTVDKGDSNVIVENIDFTYGEIIAIPFTPINAIGVNVRVINKDGDEITNTTSEDTKFTLDTLPAGEYTLEVTTIVNDNYEEFTADDINLTINKAGSDLTLNDSYEFIYGENAVINVVTENSTGNVIVSLGEFIVDVSGNEITLPALNGGKYILTVTTNVDNNHKNTTRTVIINILKETPIINVGIEPSENITVNSDVIVSVSLPEDATGFILLELNNIKLFEELANGKAKFTIANLTQDNYTVKAKYLGDNNYLEIINDTEKFTVLPDDKKTENNNITVVIDGVKYVVPLENGTVNIKTNNAPSTDDTKATTTQMKTTIKAYKKAFKAKNKVKKYTITLKAGKTPVKKVQVTIKIGKKTFKAKTNAKGKATFKIKKLTKKGKYNAVIKFKGNKAYKASSKKVKITLK